MTMLTTASEQWPVLVNGVACDTISIRDRGLQFGDGLFETIAIRNGKIIALDFHLERLARDSQRLGFNLFNPELLNKEISQVSAGYSDAIVKIIVTRGINNRGYSIDSNSINNRIISLHPWISANQELASKGINLGISAVQLASQPQLAGIKHLNRLEQVLATAELTKLGTDDALLLDNKSAVTETCRANIFWRKDATLYTPELSRCGVAGVTRARILKLVAELTATSDCPIENLSLETGHWPLESLKNADEVLTCNSITGILPVNKILSIGSFTLGPLTAWLQSQLFPDWLKNSST